MIKTYVLIMIFSLPTSGGYNRPAVVTQEFSNLAQCQYVYSVLSRQQNVSAGGCFEK